jgi:hypothetical protein
MARLIAGGLPQPDDDHADEDERSAKVEQWSGPLPARPGEKPLPGRPCGFLTVALCGWFASNNRSPPVRVAECWALALVSRTGLGPSHA